MSARPDSVTVAISILSLLLVGLGLLLTYFEWSAARRREFLYLYLAEEKPGVNYFASARRRRAQSTRLLVAFFILFIQEFIDTTLFISSANAVYIEIWVKCLSTLGLAMLGLGLLYDAESESRSPLNVVIVFFITVWTLFMLAVMGNVFGTNTQHVVDLSWHYGRTGLCALLVWGAWRRGHDEKSEPLPFEWNMLAVCFGVWSIGPLTDSIKLGQFGVAICYGLLVGLLMRSVLGEYEQVESTRHRFGRERAVIFSFLQRIGGAFTAAVEVEQVLHIIMETGLESTEASAGAIYLYHADTGLLEPRVVLNFFPPMHVDTPAASSAHRTEELEAEMKRQRFQLGEGVIGQVAQEGKAKIIDDVRAQKVMLGTTTDFMRNRSMLIVPLKIRNEPLGVMAVLNKQRGSFGSDDQSLLQALADQGALSINNAMLTVEVAQQERLRRDLQIARNIQKRLLPESCPIVPGFEIAARGSSATEVGGDYYDFFWVDDDRLGIVVADVSGKGVPAALTMAMMRSVFRTQARGNPDVRAVLANVNQFMGQDLRSRDFITCVYGILEVSTRRFSWARAGHEPIIVAHDAAPTDILSPEGFALGVVDSPAFDESLEVDTVQLRTGDRLLIFTDGLTEAMNAEGEQFGMERILNVMSHDPALNGGPPRSDTEVGLAGQRQTDRSACAPELSSNDPDDLQTLERAVHDHVLDAPQSDDLTIVYLSAK